MLPSLRVEKLLDRNGAKPPTVHSTHECATARGESLRRRTINHHRPQCSFVLARRHFSTTHSQRVDHDVRCTVSVARVSVGDALEAAIVNHSLTMYPMELGIDRL
jgi:hypothetical protein